MVLIKALKVTKYFTITKYRPHIKFYKKCYIYDQAVGRLGAIHNSVNAQRQPNLLTRTTGEISVRR
jgi:hypothetical protein